MNSSLSGLKEVIKILWILFLAAVTPFMGQGFSLPLGTAKLVLYKPSVGIKMLSCTNKLVFRRQFLAWATNPISMMYRHPRPSSFISVP
jgi:hypothetical protein